MTITATLWLTAAFAAIVAAWGSLLMLRTGREVSALAIRTSDLRDRAEKLGTRRAALLSHIEVLKSKTSTSADRPSEEEKLTLVRQRIVSQIASRAIDELESQGEGYLFPGEDVLAETVRNALRKEGWVDALYGMQTEHQAGPGGVFLAQNISRDYPGRYYSPLRWHGGPPSPLSARFRARLATSVLLTVLLPNLTESARPTFRRRVPTSASEIDWLLGTDDEWSGEVAKSDQ